MRNRPLGPSFHKIIRVSPSLNEILRMCFLRAAFQADDQFSDVRSLSTAAALGTVSHHLLQAAIDGEFRCKKEEEIYSLVEQRWSQLVEIESNNLQLRSLGQVPVPLKWPKYSVRKATACRLAFRLACTHMRASIAGQAKTSQTKTEALFHGYDGKLFGRVDFIRTTNLGIELIDYKSGLIYERNTNGEMNSHLLGSYERQVLLYAALVHENEGQWPTKVIVESVIDGPHQVDVTPEAAEKTVEEALNLLNEYNRQAVAGNINGTPNEVACNWCEFKALCLDFLTSTDISWSLASTTAIGTVLNVQTKPPTFISMKISGGNLQKTSSILRGIPVDEAKRIENIDRLTLSMSNVRKVFGSSDLEFEWASQFWQW
jgi:hypothetical protein